MKDLTKIYIDLSKCTEEQIKSLPKIFENSVDKVLPETLSDLMSGKITDGFKFLFYSPSGWNQNDYPLNDRTELTYPEFIKLFEGGDGETQVEHTCKYCGCLTTQPDSECYAAPKNQMGTLYRKSTEKPNNEGIYNTSKGLLSYSKTFGWVTIENYTISAPDYWLEEIPDRTAQLKADKAELLEALEKISKVTDEGYIFADTDFHVWESELKQVHSEIESIIQKHKQ